MGACGQDEGLRREAHRLWEAGVDTNERAMRLADFWLTIGDQRRPMYVDLDHYNSAWLCHLIDNPLLWEKDLILKLLKVPAPQYQNQNGSYTRMLQIPNWSEQDGAKMAVIEYKRNCLPPLPLPRRDSNLTLLNQLLKGLRQDLSRDQETSIHSPSTTQHQKFNWS